MINDAAGGGEKDLKTRGVILRGAPGKFEVAELELDEPREGEVLVKLAASGAVPLRRAHRS